MVFLSQRLDAYENISPILPLNYEQWESAVHSEPNTAAYAIVCTASLACDKEFADL